jgi:hypothetical protein
MTITDFKVKLTGKYPSFHTADKGELADIEDFLNQYDEKSIGTLWFNFRDDYDKGMIPRRSYFYKLADKMNLQRKTYAEAQKYEYVCYLCCAKGWTYHYQINTDFGCQCPNCKTKDIKTERGAYALVRKGTEISKERAQMVADQYRPGPWDQSLFAHHRSKIQGEFLPAGMKS